MPDYKYEVFGLLAGAGSLPVEFMRKAGDNGIKETAVLGFKGHTPDEVREKATYYQEIGFGQLGKGIKFFTSHGVKHLVLLGWVQPKLTISNLKMDIRMMMLAAKTKDRRADNVIRALISEGAKDGLTVMDNTLFLSHILVEDKILTRRAPTRRQLDDISLGKQIALAIGGLDVGQTAIVNKHAVIAVEAMEGTDNCIKRAGTIAKGCTIVKMAKPEQDFRFDVPCIGPRTIESMLEASASVLAVEAGKTYILEREKTIEMADRHKMVIIGVDR
ncbi:MAG: UDP-2,3-diacylglucosamine diphosphatase LpxI [Victivallales bacterium]|nr:UDP-2,3-diacylglucosamine diphosphatase LpxI [Victivallales bacterium]